MPRTTEQPTTTPSTPTVRPTASDPLLQLAYETAPPSGPDAMRGAQCPHELSLRGMPVVCSACRARRDWLLINHRRHVWVRCRCGNEWLEPEITRKDFDAMLTDPTWTHYPNLTQACVALGFDGSFAGLYLE
ncbi:hypothetical protein E6W39_06755 [Kitasatospora acidiphila]|uniref:Uncharacterized protein n=1 Tax=Kitasatospora acidiphila TaxID=2567942 RepID=A0A540VZ72_9ACTN|nr:hypothetical protein [Kitasatospora acidiphila]TQF02031.1 hypothetical protein E6W39_06755 [Kitasatospora acidiphila]